MCFFDRADQFKLIRSSASRGSMMNTRFMDQRQAMYFPINTASPSQVVTTTSATSMYFTLHPMKVSGGQRFLREGRSLLTPHAE